MSDNKEKSPSIVFVIKADGLECREIQADSPVLMECGGVRFIVHNDSKTTVGVFKKYEYFFALRSVP
jgi:hypothetical protein